MRSQGSFAGGLSRHWMPRKSGRTAGACEAVRFRKVSGREEGPTRKTPVARNPWEAHLLRTDSEVIQIQETPEILNPRIIGSGFVPGH